MKGLCRQEGSSGSSKGRADLAKPGSLAWPCLLRLLMGLEPPTWAHKTHPTTGCVRRYAAVFDAGASLKLAIPPASAPIQGMTWVDASTLALLVSDTVITWRIQEVASGGKAGSATAVQGPTLVLDVLGRISRMAVSPTRKAIAALTVDLVGGGAVRSGCDCWWPCWLPCWDVAAAMQPAERARVPRAPAPHA